MLVHVIKLHKRTEIEVKNLSIAAKNPHAVSTIIVLLTEKIGNSGPVWLYLAFTQWCDFY